MNQKIIIDGYNMIHQVPILASELTRDLENARAVLVERLRAYLSDKKVHVTVVFDGTGLRLPHPTFPETLNLMVRFSKPPQSADDVIKKLIDDTQHKKSLLVVSADNSIVMHAHSAGAKSVTPIDFSEIMTKKPVADDFTNKFDCQLTPKEIAKWMELFGEDES